MYVILSKKSQKLISNIKRLLVSPVFPDDEIKTRRANLLNSSLINITTLMPMLLIGDLLGGRSRIMSFTAEVLAFAFCLVLRSWMYRGRVQLASIGMIAMGIALVTAVVASLGTVRAPSTAIYLLIVINGGFLFEIRGVMITVVICSILIGGLVRAEIAGLLPIPDYSVTITQWIAYTVILAWTGSLTFSSIQVIHQALRRADNEIVDRKKVEDRLQIDLAALTRMHTLSEKVLEPGRLQPLLQEIMDSAVAIMRAERGTLQLIEDYSLRIVAHHGHDQSFLNFFEFTDNKASVCNIALKNKERAIIPDIEKSSIFVGTPSLIAMREADVRAIQSTPMISHTGVLLGIISTQWSIPYTPDEDDLWRMDLLARQAADIIEYSRYEEKLRESEQKYRNLFDNAGDAIITVDLDINVTSWNLSAEKIFGWKTGDVLGKKLNQLIIPYDMQSEFDKNVQDCIDGKKIIGISTIRQRRDGSLINVELTISTITNAEGKIIGLSGIFRDITERKMAEKAFRENQERLTTALNTAHMVIWDWDPRTDKVTFSDTASDIFGLLPGETLNNIDYGFQLIHPDDLESHRKTIQRAGELGEGWHTEFRIIRPHDGKITWLEERSMAEFDPKIGKFYFTGLVWDITERKRAEEELRKAHDDLEIRVQERTAELGEKNVKLEAEIAERKQAEEKIKEQATLLDNAQEAIGVRDLDDRLIYWNKGAQRLYGWTIEEALDKNAIEFLFKDKKDSSQIEAKRTVFEKGEWTGELNHITKSGKEVIVESHWTMIYDSEGKPKSILFINTDITEKKSFEAHLLRTQRMESIGTLAGGIAHDLNNMLTPMMMSLRMLKQKNKDEQSQKLFTILERNTHRSADLIKQVLSFSRGIEGERNPLQIKHIITEIEKIAKETFPRNIEIRTYFQRDLYTILGDVTQLHQVIMNLCVNSRDAMPNGGILNIVAQNIFIDENFVRIYPEAKVGSYITISVSDTGIGISPKIIDRIFEPFFTTKEFGKGTGLGLSTALGIIKSHGGFINVESEIGKGTTFRIYLPAIKVEIQNIEEQELEVPIGNGELVLVAEDEDTVREITITTLKENGYNVLSANDGAEAVSLYSQNKDKIKAVLMDMMMPVMDGEASIKEIRKINPDISVIVVSGLAEKDKLAKIESTHAQAILPKPYTVEKLLTVMHNVLISNK